MEITKISTLCLLGFCFLMHSCATFPRDEETYNRSNLTAGTVKKEIIKGKTSQSEVINLFGSPNLVTMNSDGEEVWDYNRMSYTTKAGTDGGSLIFWGGSRAMSSATTKSFDLIINFDKSGIVKSYNVIAASF